MKTTISESLLPTSSTSSETTPALQLEEATNSQLQDAKISSTEAARYHFSLRRIDLSISLRRMNDFTFGSDSLH